MDLMVFHTPEFLVTFTNLLCLLYQLFAYTFLRTFTHSCLKKQEENKSKTKAETKKAVSLAGSESNAGICVNCLLLFRFDYEHLKGTQMLTNFNCCN